MKKQVSPAIVAIVVIVVIVVLVGVFFALGGGKEEGMDDATQAELQEKFQKEKGQKMLTPEAKMKKSMKQR